MFGLSDEAARAWRFIEANSARFYESPIKEGFRELAGYGLLREVSESDTGRGRFELTREGLGIWLVAKKAREVAP